MEKLSFESRVENRTESGRDTLDLIFFSNVSGARFGWTHIYKSCRVPEQGRINHSGAPYQRKMGSLFSYA